MIPNGNPHINHSTNVMFLLLNSFNISRAIKCEPAPIIVELVETKITVGIKIANAFVILLLPISLDIA